MDDQHISQNNLNILSAIVFSSEDAIISKLIDGTITTWNPSAEKIFGFSEREAIGKSITLIIPEEFLAEEADIISRIKKGEKIEHYETIRRRKDGSLFPVAISVSPIKNHEDSIIGASKIARDLTEYKTFEENNALLASIVQSSDDAIISKNLNGIITSWNDGAQHIFGYSCSEAIGKHISIIIPSFKLDEEAMIIEKIRKGERLNHIETIRIRKDGQEIPVSITISPVKTANGKIIGASKIARDISERVELEKQKKMVTERLERLNEYKDEFMSMASHELKTPLTVVKANLQILDLVVQTEQEKMFLNRATAQVDKLTELISHLLDVSKIQSGQLELQITSFDVIELYTEVIKNIRITNPDYEIIFNCHPGDIIIKADRYRVEQVINNILINAIKYSPVNKKIEVIIKIEDHQVISGITDCGIGILPEDIEMIFTRFFRASGVASTFAGSGIGLYISSQIVKRHGGKMWVDSEFDKGSSFYFSLPV